MVNGEQSQSQRMIGLPFTVYCLPHAFRSALSALRQGGQSKDGAFGSGLFTILAAQRPPGECIDGHRLKSRRNEHLFLLAHRYPLDCRCLTLQSGR
jgi:hypothetical protein